MSDEERQKHLKESMDTSYKLENTLDFSDCETVECVIEAACKLLVDNWDVAVEGSYIREIITDACYESFTRTKEINDY